MRVSSCVSTFLLRIRTATKPFDTEENKIEDIFFIQYKRFILKNKIVLVRWAMMESWIFLLLLLSRKMVGIYILYSRIERARFHKFRRIEGRFTFILNHMDIQWNIMRHENRKIDPSYLFSILNHLLKKLNHWLKVSFNISFNIINRIII